MNGGPGLKNKLNWLQILLGCFFCFAVIAPLLSMFLTIDAVHLKSVFSNKAFRSAAYNSVTIQFYIPVVLPSCQSC